MENKFNIGDIIIMIKEEIGLKETYRPQIVLDNTSKNGYLTRFMDTGIKNNFAFDCKYSSNCILLSKWDNKYSNGIPVNWEVEI